MGVAGITRAKTLQAARDQHLRVTITTLAAVHRMGIRRRLRIAVLSSFAVAIVALSWLAPGWLAPGWLAPGWLAPVPESPATGPVESISYQQCAPEFLAAPNYGTRALTYDCVR
jgi:hypothetical protein